MSNDRRNCIVLGVGNLDRGDDAAGRVVARILRDVLPADVEVVEHDGEATALLARLQEATAAILVDACVSGASPGTILRFDAAAAPLPGGQFGLSTHGFGIGEAIELARALGQLPPQCIVYGIEAGSFAPGTLLSPAVAAAVTDVANQLFAEICGTQKPETKQAAPLRRVHVSM
jgi:hydrogenase maturation protease